MQLVKRTYVDVIRRLADVAPFATFIRGAQRSSPYGWRKWGGSLFAIYDTRRMVALDCPWWNVAATREIEQFLAGRAEARVFEYGSGASTAWIAKRATSIVSVEHDQGWLAKFRALLAPFDNVELTHRTADNDGAEYANAIAEFGGKFDMIVVDGRRRTACLAAALPYLAEGGIVVFDDSGRRRYRDAIERSGLDELHFYGRSFCVPYPDHTSVLRRP